MIKIENVRKFYLVELLTNKKVLNLTLFVIFLSTIGLIFFNESLPLFLDTIDGRFYIIAILIFISILIIKFPLIYSSVFERIINLFFKVIESLSILLKEIQKLLLKTISIKH